ncbi:MAG: pyruvate kinase [Bacteroidales bacterium]|nr:pyruvate kinase [Bacteroidales bacterium]
MRQRKHTKIVATISDQRCSEDFLRELHEAGMDVVRINTAHQDLEGSRKVVESVRKVSDKIAILVDTKGPEIRTTVTRDPIEVASGEEVKFFGDPEKPSLPGEISVTYPGFVDNLSVGDKILVDDGDVAFTVIKKETGYLLCKALNKGWIRSRKSVNVPGVTTHLPALNEKDRTYIRFAVENDLEFIAHSFVRNKEDIIQIQQILDEYHSEIKIIAKIENQEGVDHIEEILDHAYGVMVARGDLGIEIPAEKIPGIQRRLVSACIRRKKPVIIATQMLYTMIEHPRPTRAEITDVADAIYFRTDAIMLSGETAFGKYPVEAVKTMTRVALEVEKARGTSDITISSIDNEIAAFLANMTIQASSELETEAVILDTLSGRTARYIAAFRNRNTIFAACYSPRVVRELALSYGVYPFYMHPASHTDAFKRAVASYLLQEGEISPDHRVVLVGGSFGPRKGASFLEVGKVSDLVYNLNP